MLALRNAEGGVVDQVRVRQGEGGGGQLAVVMLQSPNLMNGSTAGGVGAEGLFLLEFTSLAVMPCALRVVPVPLPPPPHHHQLMNCTVCVCCVQVMLTTNDSGQKFIKVRVRTICIPQVRIEQWGQIWVEGRGG